MILSHTSAAEFFEKLSVIRASIAFRLWYCICGKNHRISAVFSVIISTERGSGRSRLERGDTSAPREPPYDPPPGPYWMGEIGVIGEIGVHHPPPMTGLTSAKAEK